MSIDPIGPIRHVLFLAASNPSTDALQAAMESQGYTVMRVAEAADAERMLHATTPVETRVVVDTGHGVGAWFLSHLHRFPAWLEAPVVYLLNPGRTPPPEPGVVLKQPVTAPILVRTLGALDESGAGFRADTSGSSITRVGDYEILAKIASGGMGTVYLAQRRNQIGFHRLHAVKLMHPHLVEDPEVTASFIDEAAVASRVHHGNVAAIVDLGVENERPYIVMQYVEGCSLSALLRARRGPAASALAGTILLDVLDGLHSAHSLLDDDGAPMAIVHRDVSPENILVGIDGIARIADFGIAKARNRVSSTEHGVRKGKLLYLAPEQLRDQEVDPRVDVYAAGVVLWNALTGRRLFAGESQASILHKIATAVVVPPSKVEASVPPALDAVCLRALARDRNKRYSSAAEMAEALSDAMDAGGLSASPHDVGEWVRSVCGEELDVRRALARERRRQAGVPSMSVPVLPSALGADASTSSAQQRTELVRNGAGEGADGSWTPRSGPTSTAHPRPRTRFAPYVVLGAVSIVAGVFFSARCVPEESPARDNTDEVRRAAAESTPPPVAPPRAPTNTPSPPEVAPAPAHEPEPSEAPVQTPRPGPATSASTATDVERPPAKAPRTRRRGRRGKAQRPGPATAQPTEVEETTTPKRDPAPVERESKPRQRDASPDPLDAGPERNPYK